MRNFQFEIVELNEFRNHRESEFDKLTIWQFVEASSFSINVDTFFLTNHNIAQTAIEN